MSAADSAATIREVVQANVPDRVIIDELGLGLGELTRLANGNGRLTKRQAQAAHRLLDEVAS